MKEKVSKLAPILLVQVLQVPQWLDYTKAKEDEKMLERTEAKVDREPDLLAHILTLALTRN